MLLCFSFPCDVFLSFAKGVPEGSGGPGSLSIARRAGGVRLQLRDHASRGKRAASDGLFIEVFFKSVTCKLDRLLLLSGRRSALRKLRDSSAVVLVLYLLKLF